MRLKFELTNQYSAGGKNSTVLTSMHVNKKALKLGTLETALYIHEEELESPKIYQTVKSEKYEAFCFSKNGSTASGNWPGRIIVT